MSIFWRKYTIPLLSEQIIEYKKTYKIKVRQINNKDYIGLPDNLIIEIGLDEKPKIKTYQRLRLVKFFNKETDVETELCLIIKTLEKSLNYVSYNESSLKIRLNELKKQRDYFDIAINRFYFPLNKKEYRYNEELILKMFYFSELTDFKKYHNKIGPLQAQLISNKKDLLNVKYTTDYVNNLNTFIENEKKLVENKEHCIFLVYAYLKKKLTIQDSDKWYFHWLHKACNEVYTVIQPTIEVFNNAKELSYQLNMVIDAISLLKREHYGSLLGSGKGISMNKEYKNGQKNKKIEIALSSDSLEQITDSIELSANFLKPIPDFSDEEAITSIMKLINNNYESELIVILPEAYMELVDNYSPEDRHELLEKLDNRTLAVIILNTNSPHTTLDSFLENENEKENESELIKYLNRYNLELTNTSEGIGFIRKNGV